MKRDDPLPPPKPIAEAVAFALAGQRTGAPRWVFENCFPAFDARRGVHVVDANYAAT